MRAEEKSRTIPLKKKPAMNISNGQHKSDSSGAERDPAGLALREQLHFLQTLIDTIPSPIFYKDINNLYLGCNKAFENRLGLNKEKIIGRSAYQIFPQHLAEKYHRMDLELLHNPGEQVYEDSLLYADGKLHDVIIKKGTFTNIDGSLAGLVGVTVDISERKRAEKELQKAHDDLELRVQTRTAELAAANEELRLEIAERTRVEEALKESSEKLKFFAYSVMHDLKSPTIGICGFAKLLQRQYEEVLDERGMRFCSQILNASEHLASLVEKINTYITSKELPLKVEKVPLAEIIQVVRDEFSALLSARKVKLTGLEHPVEIEADKMSLLRVFRNFVDNALKYGGKDLSEISIGYERFEAFHLFSVTDDGIGIRGDHLEKIFGLFQRSETARGTQGAGLGLAIVKEIAERHGGRVWVEPRPDRGTVFYISLAKDVRSGDQPVWQQPNLGDFS